MKFQKTETTVITLTVLLLIAVIIGLWRTSPRENYPELIAQPLYQKAIGEIPKNLSGLAPGNDNTLYAVTNAPETLHQLDRSGNLVNSIPLPGFQDTEAVEYLGNGKFLIAEERKRRISLIRISADNRITKIASGRFDFTDGRKKNYGIEGLAWSEKYRTLFIANEKRPARVWKITGSQSSKLPPGEVIPLFTAKKDISGLAWDEKRERLYILSDEDKSITETDIFGTVLRASRLDNFVRHIPQPEGIAVNNDKIYVVSEPNILYLFKMRTESDR